MAAKQKSGKISPSSMPKGNKIAGSRCASPQRIADILADVDTIGGVAAARKHNVSYRTLCRYKADRAHKPEVVLALAEKRKVVADAMHDETVAVLRKITSRISTLVDNPDTPLSAITQAYKVIGDRLSADNVAEQILGGASEAPVIDQPTELKLVRGGL